MDMRKKRKIIIKSGIRRDLFLVMDDVTFKSHFRLTRTEYESLLGRFSIHGLRQLAQNQVGGPERIPIKIQLLILLWYMANRNSFREIGDRFNVAKSEAHRIIIRLLDIMMKFSNEIFQWPSPHERIGISSQFSRKCSVRNIIGAIDGCHIKINKPETSGNSFFNRKGYYSIILQGICDENMRFTDIFVGAPGKVHDSRVLRKSTFFPDREEKMGNMYLLGDTAYAARDFSNFILTPKKDYGNLTDEDIQNNFLISRGRVVIENCFGRLKCKFQRAQDLQNSNLVNCVKLIIAACTLHNLSINSDHTCEDHPLGCPRQEDGFN